MKRALAPAVVSILFAVACTAVEREVPPLSRAPDNGRFTLPDDVGEDGGVPQVPEGPVPDILVTVLGASTTEAGGTTTLSVRLAKKPTADVIVPAVVSNGAEASASPSSLAFTAADWDVPQQVTVTGKDDLAADGDVDYQVTFGPATSADVAYEGIITPVTLTNRDDDTPGIETAPPATTHTTEAGGAITFTVVLRSRPTSNVTVPLSVSVPAEASVAPAALVFTPDDWTTPKTVTVTGANDDSDDGDVAYAVVLGAATSADAAYAGIDAADVPLTNDDDDTAGIVVEVLGTTTTELGGTATVKVKLATKPTATVTIPTSTSKPGEATVPAASIAFDTTNWATSQLVVVTGVDDLTADGDAAFDLVLGTSTSTDPLYATRNPADVAMTNQDRPRDGASQGNAAKTCALLHAAFPALGTGSYFIDPEGGATADAFSATCDMNLDDGGFAMLGRGAYWLGVDDTVPSASDTQLSAARMARIVTASGSLFRLGTGAARLFVRDAAARIEPGFSRWRSNGNALTCTTSYAAVVGNTMAAAGTFAVTCDPLAPGSHDCGNAVPNGWILYAEGDTYDPSGTHPCSFGAGVAPTAGTLTDLWVR